MSTTATENEAKDATAAVLDAAEKVEQAEAQTKPKRTRKPAEKPASKPAAKKPEPRKSPVTVRKALRARSARAAKWHPLDAHGRTSKARGSKPMRRCKECIRNENQARREAAKPVENPEPKAEKPAPKNSRRTRTNKSSATKPEAQYAERAL